MPYDNTDQLRQSLQDKLPKHAQEIFMEAYNNAYERFSDPSKIRGDDTREEASNKVAWSAVKKEYEKGSDGKWHRTDRKAGDRWLDGRSGKASSASAISASR